MEFEGGEGMRKRWLLRGAGKYGKRGSRVIFSKTLEWHSVLTEVLQLKGTKRAEEKAKKSWEA